MLAIDRQAEKIRRRDALIRQLYMLVITLGLIIIVLAGMIFAMTRSAAAADCMTYSQAREKWPKAHLYWHTSDRCWDNRRGGRRYHRIKDVPAKIYAKMLPAPVYNVLPPPRPVIVMVEEDLEGCCWPPLEDEQKEQALKWLADKLKYETQSTQENPQRR